MLKLSEVRVQVAGLVTTPGGGRSGDYGGGYPLSSGCVDWRAMGNNCQILLNNGQNWKITIL